MKVSLVQDEHGTHTSLAGENHVTLEAAGVEIMIQASDDEEDIEVSCQNLGTGFATRTFALEHGLAVEHGFDPAFGTEHYPVSGSGPKAAFAAEATAGLGIYLAVFGPDLKVFSLSLGNSAWSEAGVGFGLEGEKFAPADGIKIHDCLPICVMMNTRGVSMRLRA